MRRDRRPYYIKKAYIKLQKFYLNHFLRPQFDYLGKGITCFKPWHVEVFGAPIKIDDYATLIATPDQKVRFSIWSHNPNIPGIQIGKYSLICPGVRISAAQEITIADNCMLAHAVYITDSDWHGIYDRSFPVGKSAPVYLEENVWLGDSVIVTKGVTIHKNSIIGAGSVVIDDIPENCIAAGNPAKVVKKLDETQHFITRGEWLANPEKISRDFDVLDRENL
ncbi:MAG: acyltransferase, partial [Desulfobacterales bacterium]|nr:acyltransferase [Desulfobacterales bacterium]